MTNNQDSTHAETNGDEPQPLTPEQMKRRVIRIVIGAVLAVVLATAVYYQFIREEIEVIPLNRFIEMALEGDVKKVEVKSLSVTGPTLTVFTDDGGKYITYGEAGVSVIETLESAGVNLQSFDISVVKDTQLLERVLFQLLSLIFMMFFVIMFLTAYYRFQTEGWEGLWRLTKARKYQHQGGEVTFDDVAGADDAKFEFQEIVEYLREPEKFVTIGAKVPKGILLSGPPGTGKTLMARATAGEAKVPFLYLSASEFIELFVGLGAKRVRELFKYAKKQAPCIVFIDEIDSVGGHRSQFADGFNEREQTLNQILTHMDGFEQSTNVVVIAATNRADMLDEALLRPGRFDRKIIMIPPDVKGRREILDVHTKEIPISPSVDRDYIARQTTGFTGADIATMVNEAAILAARDNRVEVGQEDLTEAIDRVVAGPALKSRWMTDEEKKITAYHEGGHAMLGELLPHADPVAKVTIVQRSESGGHTRFMPEKERNFWRKEHFLDIMATALAGRASEEVVFGHVTTGAVSDMQQATQIAHKMVTSFGMSEKLPPRSFDPLHLPSNGIASATKVLSQERQYSEETALLIDDEVNRLITEAYEKSLAVVRQNRNTLDRIAERLLEQETLVTDDLTKIVGECDDRRLENGTE